METVTVDNTVKLLWPCVNGFRNSVVIIWFILVFGPKRQQEYIISTTTVLKYTYVANLPVYSDRFCITKLLSIIQISHVLSVFFS